MRNAFDMSTDLTLNDLGVDYFASASAVVAQAVAAAEIHWLTPYGNPLSKYA